MLMIDFRAEGLVDTAAIPLCCMTDDTGVL